MVSNLAFVVAIPLSIYVNSLKYKEAILYIIQRYSMQRTHYHGAFNAKLFNRLGGCSYLLSLRVSLEEPGLVILY